jgi:hypothetical protein
MKKQNIYLTQALERIFLSTEHIGFWDEKNSCIHSKLIFDKKWNWTVSSDTSDRYGVFTITMILLAKFINNLNISKYESKIILYLDYIKNNISNYKKSDITYGAFNALVLGQILFEDDGKNYKSELLNTYQFLKKEINSITNNEDALVLIGLNLYYKYINKDKDVLSYIEVLVESLLNTQSKKGFFLTGDIRAVYHQRAMYTLWGLSFSSLHTHKDEIKIAIEKSINYIWFNRRDGKDNAFIWHPLFYIIKTRSNLFLPIISPYSANYLFECHQTFFANAIAFYQNFYKTTKFTEYKQKALDWIFGVNRIKEDIISITKLNIPTRIMSRKGKLNIKNNNFIGSYEIGSYIFALSNKNYLNNL